MLVSANYILNTDCSIHRDRTGFAIAVKDENSRQKILSASLILANQNSKPEVASYLVCLNLIDTKSTRKFNLPIRLYTDQS